MYDKFDEKLKHSVRNKMSKHKKVSATTAMGAASGRTMKIDHASRMTEMVKTLEHEEEKREKRVVMHELINTGLETLFPDTKETIEWLDSSSHSDGDADEKQYRALLYQCTLRLQEMDLEDVDDLVYFLDLLEDHQGSWYWNHIEEGLRKAINNRLHVLAKEEEEEDE